jgi:deazaflavin-dependent oxidoreductase (nitroreductase family)
MARSAAAVSGFPPGYLKVANRMIVGLHRLGVPAPMPALTVRGRSSGRPQTTPVHPYEVNGQRYVVGGHAGSDWVKNARAAGEATLSYGRRHEQVRLVDLPESERGSILREFPTKVPRGVPMFFKAGTVENASPEAFEAAAPRCAVFRIEPLT